MLISFDTLNVLLHSLLACVVSEETLDVILILPPPWVTCFCSSAFFQVFPLVFDFKGFEYDSSYSIFSELSGSVFVSAINFRTLSAIFISVISSVSFSPPIIHVTSFVIVLHLLDILFCTPILFSLCILILEVPIYMFSCDPFDSFLGFPSPCLPYLFVLECYFSIRTLSVLYYS